MLLVPLFNLWLTVPTGRYGVGSGGARIVVNEALLATSTMVAFGAELPIRLPPADGPSCPTPAIAPNWLGRFGRKRSGHSL
jgi:hypothetical protein